MGTRRIFAAAGALALLAGAAACGDDDDSGSATTTTADTGGDITQVEVTITSDGFDGLPASLPAGLVEVTLVNDSGAFASFDITRVDDGTTEEEFAEGMAPLLVGGPFPDFVQSNAGIEAEDGDTVTSTIVLREGDHIAWIVPDEGTEMADDDAIPSDDEQSMAQGTLTAVAADDDGDTTTTTDGDTPVSDDDDVTEDTVIATQDDDDGPGAGPGEGAGPTADDFVTASLTVTAGDDDAELPEADGEIVATDYAFDIDVDSSGSTINFRNDGPQQFHHAIVMDFGTNDPDVVEDEFMTLLESEGDPSAMGDSELDMDQVDFEFGGSGVFGPDGAAGTFDASFQDGNTYVVVCFIQDRTGGPPHAIAYDMWQVFQVGDGDTTTTTGG
jgi:hypothetical protein